MIFFHTQIISEEREREKQLSRQAAFICYSMGAAGEKSYSSYLSSLGLIDKGSNKMKKEVKAAVAKQAHENATHILELYKRQHS